MSEDASLFAARLEALFPRVIRALFQVNPDDPLADLPMAQFRVLRLLEMGELTISDLGDHLGMSASAVTQMANRLEAAGLVDRREDLDDRRVRILSLSEAAKSRLAIRRKHRIASAQQVLARLPRERQEAIVTALEELLTVSQVNLAHSPESLSVTAEIERPPTPRPTSRI